MAEVALRLIEDAGLGALFDQMRDPESVWMAAVMEGDTEISCASARDAEIEETILRLDQSRIGLYRPATCGFTAATSACQPRRAGLS